MARPPAPLTLTPMDEPGPVPLARAGGSAASVARADARASHLKLLAWLSPSFPIGAYSYSSGLEWAVEAGVVRDADALAAWIGAVLAHGAGWTDAVLLCRAWRAARDGDGAELCDAAELALALQPSRERLLEAAGQGNAFLTAVLAAWPAPAVAAFRRAWRGDVAYPVAVGVAAAAHGIPLEDTLPAYLHALTANLVSAGVRLVPLGQTAGLMVIAGLEPLLLTHARAAIAAGPEDFGGAALLADIAAMRHETQQTRIFRS